MIHRQETRCEFIKAASKVVVSGLIAPKAGSGDQAVGCCRGRRRLASASMVISLAGLLFVAVMAQRPASAQYQVFWGDVHGHTSHSDGHGSLDDYFSYGRDISKLDFVNHKNVYFPRRIEHIFSAKDPATMSPNLLAEALRRHGGLVHNNHPSSGPDGKNQWDYEPFHYSVITNTEMYADTMYYEGKTYQVNIEQAVRDFLDQGGKTGFVRGSDTHEGKPEARTAVLAKELTREAIFDALRHRRNFAVTNARIVLSFKIDGHEMGEEIETAGKPHIDVETLGTDLVRDVEIIRDGKGLHSLNPGTQQLKFRYVDESFRGNSYYYLRVTQADKDEHGNLLRAWSSPI